MIPSERDARGPEDHDGSASYRPAGRRKPCDGRLLRHAVRGGEPGAKGRDAKAMLDDNDGHSFFEMLGDSLVTGPTRTNVNDFRATLIAP